MTNELKQALNKIVELSKTSTLCGQYNNGVIAISFMINDDLTITEQATGDSFSIWCNNESMSTPTEINLKYADIKSFEFITEAEMTKRSNGECNLSALEITIVDGSDLTIFEDVA